MSSGALFILCGLGLATSRAGEDFRFVTSRLRNCDSGLYSIDLEGEIQGHGTKKDMLLFVKCAKLGPVKLRLVFIVI